MYSMPSISVIVPVYNVEKYIHRCVDSILGQTYTDFELILVDDGSTDHCSAVCDEYARMDSRVKAIHQMNRGLSEARNAGLDAAQGEYICFVDPDDYLPVCALEIMHNHLIASDAQCCVCGYQAVDANGQITETHAVEDGVLLPGLQAIRERYLSNNLQYNIVNVWGKLFHRDLWKGIRFTAGIQYEDLDIMPLLYSRCGKVSFIPDIGYYYFLREGSLVRSGGTNPRRYIDSLCIRDKHCSFYQSIGEKDLAVYSAERGMDLIITSACNDWIPDEEKAHSKKVFCRFMKCVLASSKVTVKSKLRYLLFGFLGAQGYKRIAKIGK